MDSPVVGPSLGTRVDRLWGTVAAELGELHIVGWDLPGHGLSPATSADFGLGDLASAVLAAVDSAVGADAAATPYLYAGDSVGGAVGLQLLLDHPARFRAAAAFCSGARFGTPQAWATGPHSYGRRAWRRWWHPRPAAGSAAASRPNRPTSRARRWTTWPRSTRRATPSSARHWDTST
ncbi:hypothetical protein DDE18_21540 [Nocardioides gansuensis]|uniref:Serine aminopeptidase S33 domain-containing protein n=1 Tax=Nocardioides gansuensis TaxID=2138300 RepID=A0A2T8F4U1_9ACTN|nr:hypothetical protein DDE18_21540 [Nocardioides gansuensis]